MNEHVWKIVSYGNNYTNYYCEKCYTLHKSIEDDPSTWLTNFKEECINKNTKGIKNEMGNRK